VSAKPNAAASTAKRTVYRFGPLFGVVSEIGTLLWTEPWTGTGSTVETPFAQGAMCVQFEQSEAQSQRPAWCLHPARSVLRQPRASSEKSVRRMGSILFARERG
jgi:hypothetical protein